MKSFTRSQKQTKIKVHRNERNNELNSNLHFNAGCVQMHVVSIYNILLVNPNKPILCILLQIDWYCDEVIYLFTTEN